MGSNKKKHNLLPNAKLKYANMKMRGLCFFPLYNWLNCHCWRLHGFLFPLQPYSIGQTEKYIATDETHHLGTPCFQLPAEVSSKTLQLPFWKKRSIRCDRLYDLESPFQVGDFSKTKISASHYQILACSLLPT